MRRALLVGLLVLVAACVAACVGEEEYVYSARRYDARAECFDPYAPVETVPGEGAGSQCPASCLTTGGEVYVTSMCPPLPGIASAVPAGTKECQAALAALKGGRTCGAASAEAGDEAGDDGGDASEGDASEGDAADAATDSADVRDAADAG